MKVQSVSIEVQTRGKGTYEITAEIEDAVRASEIRTGIATVFVQHTSASLILFENADPTARADLHKFFDHFVPENAEYFQHVAEGPDDMPSHLRTVLTRTSECIPIASGRLQLGTWQGIFLFEHRRKPHLRTVTISVIGE